MIWTLVLHFVFCLRMLCKVSAIDMDIGTPFCFLFTHVVQGFRHWYGNWTAILFYVNACCARVPPLIWTFVCHLVFCLCMLCQGSAIDMDIGPPFFSLLSMLCKVSAIDMDICLPFSFLFTHVVPGFGHWYGHWSAILFSVYTCCARVPPLIWTLVRHFVICLRMSFQGSAIDLDIGPPFCFLFTHVVPGIRLPLIWNWSAILFSVYACCARFSPLIWKLDCHFVFCLRMLFQGSAIDLDIGPPLEPSQARNYKTIQQILYRTVLPLVYLLWFATCYNIIHYHF